MLAVQYDFSLKSSTPVASFAVGDGKEEVVNGTQLNDKKESKVIIGLRWTAYAGFTSVAIFWIIQVLTTYFSYPVSSVVNLVDNKTFVWPDITLCSGVTCFNETILEKMSQKYNMPYIGHTRTGDWTYPFMGYKQSNFDWDNHTIHEMLWKAKYTRLSDILATCEYIHRDGLSGGSGYSYDCLSSSKLGSWRTYATENGVCHSFHPIPAVDLSNRINLQLNHTKCREIIVALHSSDEVYYISTPSSLTFVGVVGNESMYDLNTAVQTFSHVNRKSSPCEEDENYSQARCLHEKSMEWLIRNGMSPATSPRSQDCLSLRITLIAATILQLILLSFKNLQSEILELRNYLMIWKQKERNA